MLMRVGCGCAMATGGCTVPMRDGLVVWACLGLVCYVATVSVRNKVVASIGLLRASATMGDGWFTSFEGCCDVAQSGSGMGKSGDGGWIDAAASLCPEGRIEGPKSAWAAWPGTGWLCFAWMIRGGGKVVVGPSPGHPSPVQPSSVQFSSSTVAAIAGLSDRSRAECSSAQARLGNNRRGADACPWASGRRVPGTPWVPH